MLSTIQHYLYGHEDLARLNDQQELYQTMITQHSFSEDNQVRLVEAMARVDGAQNLIGSRKRDAIGPQGLRGFRLLRRFIET